MFHQPIKFGPQGACDFKVQTKLQPAKVGQPIKEAQNIYYPPDGSGRDTYIIHQNGGTCIQFQRQPNIKLEDNQFLRSPEDSPSRRVSPHVRTTMNSRERLRIQALKTYNNWPSRHAVEVNRKNFLSQEKTLKRLSPPIKRSRNGPLRLSHSYLKPTTLLADANSFKSASGVKKLKPLPEKFYNK